MSTINPTQASMLGLFGDQVLTGNDLIMLAHKYMGPYWSVTRSQVYRELITLNDMGLIVQDKTNTPFRNRQHYKITETGKKAFQDWLTQPVEGDSVRSNLAVRIAFADNMSDEQLLLMIDEGISNARRDLFRIQKLRKTAEKDNLHWDSLALRLSEMQAQTTVRWLQEIKKEVG